MENDHLYPTLESVFASLRFEDVVQLALDAKEMTQSTLAKETGLSSGYVSKIITGKALPTNPGVIRRIATVLDLPSDLLYKNALMTKRIEKSFREEYPNIWTIISTVTELMKYKDKTKTLKRIENRIREFAPNKYKLALAIVKLISGEISIDDEYSLNERPIRHYIAEWNPEIENWKKHQNKTDSDDNKLIEQIYMSIAMVRQKEEPPHVK